MSHELLKTQHHDGADADARLKFLGMDARGLLKCIRIGENARAEATDFDPVAAGALDAYRYRVRTFREEFVPMGWVVDREGGVEGTRSPSGCKVITRAGNEATGLRDRFPQPKRTVGPGTRDLVSQGVLSPDWFNAAPANSSAGDVQKNETWMFLVHREGDVVRAEVSRPTGISEDGDVLGWYERIYLPVLDLSDPSAMIPVAPDSDAQSGIDVPVIRKR